MSSVRFSYRQTEATVDQHISQLYHGAPGFSEQYCPWWSVLCFQVRVSKLKVNKILIHLLQLLWHYLPTMLAPWHYSHESIPSSLWSACWTGLDEFDGISVTLATGLCYTQRTGPDFTVLSIFWRKNPSLHICLICQIWLQKTFFYLRI